MSTNTSAMTQSYSLASGKEALKAHAALRERIRDSQFQHRRLLASLADPPTQLLELPVLPSPTSSPSPSPSPPLHSTQGGSHSLCDSIAFARVIQRTDRGPTDANRSRPDLSLVKRARVERFLNYVPEEETIRNDYSQRYVDGGEWPQNWVLGAEPERRFEEYPKQQRLLALKKAAVEAAGHPPTHLALSSLATLHPAKFDVILLDPPFSSSCTWDTLADLPVPQLAADPSFIFLWVGSGAGDGLERGRELLARWGYRRCEDVVWCKTNMTRNAGPGADPPTTSLFTRTKQHCLMGIRGTVRRSTDNWFVHCNIDTDVIIWEGDSNDPTRKPPEMYTLIENFCLGTRRLEVFGRHHSLRRGWVTAGDFKLTQDLIEHTGVRSWDREVWEGEVRREGGKTLVASTAEIDNLRPKSPVRQDRNANSASRMSNASHTPVLGGGFQGNPGPGPGFHGSPGPGFQGGPGQFQQPMGMNMAPMGMGGMPMSAHQSPAFGGAMGGMPMGGPMGGHMGMPMGMPVAAMGMPMMGGPMSGFSYNQDGSMTYGRAGVMGGGGPGNMGMGMGMGGGPNMWMGHDGGHGMMGAPGMMGGGGMMGQQHSQQGGMMGQQHPQQGMMGSGLNPHAPVFQGGHAWGGGGGPGWFPQG